MRGLSETLGLVFGLLYLKALSPENGLTQKEISALIGKSKSTVSRMLDLLVDQGFCTYNLRDNEMARAERLYFVKGSFKGIAIERVKKSLRENALLKNSLLQVAESASRNGHPDNQELLSRITRFCELIDAIILTDKNAIEILEKHYKDNL